MVAKQGLYVEQFVRDLAVDRAVAGDTTLTIYGSYFDQSTYNIFVDDVNVKESFSVGAGPNISYLPTPLVNGQVVKVTGSYMINGEFKEGEYVTFTVGETTDPVLTINRPSLTNYDSILSHAIVTVTGILNGIQ